MKYSISLIIVGNVDYIQNQKMSSNEVKNYQPLRFLGGKGHHPKEILPAQPLQTKGDIQNLLENAAGMPTHFKRTGLNQRPESRNKSSNAQEGSLARNINNDYLTILENMDKRIKEMMREAAGLMQMLIHQQGKIYFDERLQESLRLMDDKEIQREYRLLKQKLDALRRYSIVQTSQNKKYQPYFTVPNPEVVNEKTRKLQKEVVLNLKVDLIKETQRSLSSRQEGKSSSKDRSSISKEKITLAVPQNGQHLNFALSDSLHKRAQHYKHKSMKLQAALEVVLKEEEKVNRINEEMAEELIKLRAQTLSLKYQYENKH